jgi:hypothetical protein
VLRRLYCAKGKRAKAGIGMWLCIRAYANGGIKHLPDAPEGMDPSVLDRAASLRWPIGKRFQERYGFLGMVHYERRTQQGWSRRMAFAAIARLFARNLQLSLKKNGIPATLAIASRLVPALFRKTLDAETAAAACYYTKMPRSAMQHAKRRHCALQYEKREKARSRTGHLRAGEAKRKSRSWAALIQERKAALPGAAGKRRTDLVARNSKRLMRIDSGYEARKSLFMRAYAGLRGARSRARQIFGSCMPYCL